MSEPNPCPKCGANWRHVELLKAANSGGGYHCMCHKCGHRWDDPHVSHGQHSISDLIAQRDAALADRQRLLDTIGDPGNLNTLAAAFDLPYLARIAAAVSALTDPQDTQDERGEP